MSSSKMFPFTINILIASIIEASRKHYGFDNEFLISALSPVIVRMFRNQLPLESIPQGTTSISLTVHSENRYVQNKTCKLALGPDLFSKVSIHLLLIYSALP